MTDNIEKAKEHATNQVNHGLSSHALYQVWNEIRQRTTNKNNKDYAEYASRGIGLCAAWSETPAAFIEWALDNGWAKGLQCDRINNDKGYSPSNCRWVTPKENANNRRNSPKQHEP